MIPDSTPSLIPLTTEASSAIELPRSKSKWLDSHFGANYKRSTGAVILKNQDTVECVYFRIKGNMFKLCIHYILLKRTFWDTKKLTVSIQDHSDKSPYRQDFKKIDLCLVNPTSSEKCIAMKSMKSMNTGEKTLYCFACFGLWNMNRATDTNGDLTLRFTIKYE